MLGATGFLFRSLPEVTAVEWVEMVRSTVFFYLLASLVPSLPYAGNEI